MMMSAGVPGTSVVNAAAAKTNGINSATITKSTLLELSSCGYFNRMKYAIAKNMLVATANEM